MRRAVVTGAFSYIGSAAARELLDRGWQVHTLTNRMRPDGATQVSTSPLRFDLEHLVAELRGADLFVNTYWIRLPHGNQDFQTAIAASKRLIEAARRAGVGRLVHVSVSNASPHSELGYYRGKAQVDEAVRASGLPHAIVRPTLVVGPRDVLSNNIAWFLRRFPFFPVPNGGGYRLQPVTLDDTGKIIADAAEARGDLDVDAAGPERFTFREYVQLLAKVCGVRPAILSTPDWVSLAGIFLVEQLLGDTILSREELWGLEQELLISHAAPLGTERTSAWLAAHGAELGDGYVNDAKRHFGEDASAPIGDPTTGKTPIQSG
ncbi:MAG: NmrA family NAD(P)-binding protein [Deltaproteobacteria bacterium]|nr:NmrA family NAD(P)-binding protein [Deltaproteobacteria bacterium]